MYMYIVGVGYTPHVHALYIEIGYIPHVHLHVHVGIHVGYTPHVHVHALYMYIYQTEGTVEAGI